ncbi:poly-gamma-glutamate biosynthesis protein PgsC/CapC [Sorangium sp. So ce834]|uniref:poly-gamma-glutamate biosynthesis protein PgsC/CapC n=1 Tax=Sorangium sp. So ce834 TaxID=3133321 RepID=UPI003F5F8145
MLDNLPLFPPNGLDRSLHTAVLIGLVFGTFFTETLGWTYAGLVVPGYLATVFFAAPVTAVFIIAESIVTYLFVALIGRWITRTGAWSTAFGRERFYLFIVGAVIVRLFVEGFVVPEVSARYDFVHSRELYSIGLVLVPLIANAFWNSGLVRAAPRLAVVTALTTLVLGVLLRTTNLSVSRFQVLNESLSLEFLELPKAHIILVIGALLGARNNVRYGWDYNGILVPGLLAVAWYEPTKLLTTTIEALAVYYLSRWITSVRPFSRMLLVGPRRMIFVYVLGFIVKMAIGFAMVRFAPGLQMIDYFGFGYLLPSLLAVKMWNKEHVGIVIMPTIQVSLTAFLVGNGVGYALVALGWGSAPPPPAAEARPPPRVESAALSLVLADTTPRPGPRPRAAAIAADIESRRVAHRLARSVLRDGRPADEILGVAERARLFVGRAGDGERPWYVLGARFDDPEDASSAPRAAIRRRAGRGPGAPEWLVLAAPAEVGSALPAVALRVAELLDASGVVLLSRHGAIRRHDEAFAASMIEALESPQVLLVEPGGGDGPELSVVGTPAGLPVVSIGDGLGAETAMTFRPAAEQPTLLADAPRLRVPRHVAEAVGARMLGAPEVVRWSGTLEEELSKRMVSLTEVQPGRFRPPSIEELRLFDSVVVPRLIAAATRPGGAAGAPPPTAWERAILGHLGFREVRIGGTDAAPAAWGIAEPGPEEGGPARRGNPAWLVLAKAPAPAPPAARGGDPAGPAPSIGGILPVSPSPQAVRTPLTGAMLVEVPAPRWQIGAFGAGLALAEALSAQSLLLAGAVPTAEPSGAADVRRAEGLRSFFQRAHEVWVGDGGNALSVQAIEADRSYERDAVISFGYEVVRPEHVPTFAGPLLETLRDLELRVGLFDGTREQVPFSGATDMAMAYAKRFAEGRFAIVYLGSAIRRFFELRRFAAPGQGETRLEARLTRLGVAPVPLDVAARAQALATCAGSAGAGASGDEACPTRGVTEGCDLSAAMENFRRYATERNPYYLRAHFSALAAGPGGGSGPAGHAAQGNAPALAPQGAAARGVAAAAARGVAAVAGRGVAAARPGAAAARAGAAAPPRVEARCHVELGRDVITGRPWVIAARPGEAQLLPIDGALVAVPGAAVPGGVRLRRAVTIGTSALRIEAGSPGGAAPGAPGTGSSTPASGSSTPASGSSAPASGSATPGAAPQQEATP